MEKMCIIFVSNGDLNKAENSGVLLKTANNERKKKQNFSLVNDDLSQ